MEEKAEEKPPTQAQNPPQPPIIKKSNFAPLVGALIFLGLVIAATIVYLGMQQGNISLTQNVPAPTQIPSPTTKIEVTPTIATPQLQSTTVEKMSDLAFPSYTISYPEGWTAVEDKTDLTNTLILSKNGNGIKIHQGPMGGNQCVFEGEMPDGPANDYRNTEFIEVKAGTLTFRRIPGKTSHSFCSNSPQSLTSFGVPTIFGNINYTIASADEKILEEMDMIIASLRANP